MTATTTDATDAQTLSTDDLHHLLSASRRRLAVAVLDREGPLTKGELADLIAEFEAEDSDDSPGDIRKRVYVGLHQDHLDALIGHGVVRQDGDHYDLGRNADKLLPYIDDVPRVRRWSARLFGE